MGWRSVEGPVLWGEYFVVSATGSSIAPAIHLVVAALLVLPAVFLLPETSRLTLLRGADKVEPGVAR